MSKQPCYVSTCPAFRPCPQHGGAASNRDRYRPNPRQRGYDSTWEKFRARFLAEHPLCADCTAAGRTHDANEVHHIVPITDRPDLRLVQQNCMALCKPCHGARGGKRQ